MIKPSVVKGYSQVIIQRQSAITNPCSSTSFGDQIVSALYQDLALAAAEFLKAP